MEQEARSVREKELCLLISEGDEAAFRELFHQYTPSLHAAIIKMVKTESVTNDIIQDTFLKVWINRDKLPEIAYPRLWVLRIAYYRALNFLRNQTIHQKALGKITIKADANHDTHDRVAFNNVSKCIKRAVYQLPEQQKKVYQLSRENGYKIAEIAKTMQISEQTVKNTLGRSLRFIREHLEKAGYSNFIIFWLIFLKSRY